MPRRLAEGAQRMPVRLHLARRARHGIAADPAIIEGQGIELGELVARRTFLGTRIGLHLVGEPDPAPEPRPEIAVEAGERSDHLLGIRAADVLERTKDPSGSYRFRARGFGLS